MLTYVFGAANFIKILLCLYALFTTLIVVIEAFFWETCTVLKVVVFSHMTTFTVPTLFTSL